MNRNKVKQKDEEYNIKQMNRRWELIHKYELELKKESLRKLTDQQSIDIFNRLLNIFQEAGKGNIDRLSILREEKAREIIRTHRIFNKVK
jgi:hypothetical protein